MRTETGVPLSFHDHLFLYDFYADWTPNIVCYKAAQVGFTTAAIFKSTYAVKKFGIDGIYTLPTESDIRDFSGGKVNRIINNNLILQEYTTNRDTIEQKAFGNNLMYYRGTFTEKAALMISSDLNIHDEEDRSNQAVVAQYASRQQHSAVKWNWRFSNPSVRGNGVDRYWDDSDQKHWFIKCLKCKKEQYLSWPESVCLERKVYQCKVCKAPLTRESRRVGRWVRKYKDKKFSGYWISLLMAPWVEAEEIIDYYHNKPIDYFYNFVLGLPYVGEGNTVTPETIYKNCTREINSQDFTIIGCDSGLRKHYVLGNREGIYYYGVTDTWDDIRKLLKSDRKTIAVIDALPDLTAPRELREEFPGRVYLCHYARDRKTFQLIRWGQDRESGNVTVDRNRMMQVVIDELETQRVPLQGNRDDWVDYYKHWKTLYKLTKPDSLGVPQFTWETSDGNDHWCHATLYWRVGMDRFGHSGGAILSPAGSPVKGIPTAPAINPDDTVAVRDTKIKFMNPSKQPNDWRNT